MGKQKVGGKCAEKGVEAVAVAPAGMRTRRCTGQRRKEELEELEAAFNMKLFVIAATVKQASNPTSGANHAALRDMRLDLLRQSHQFVHEEFEKLREYEKKLKKPAKAEPPECSVSYRDQLLLMQEEVGDEEKWAESSTTTLGERLGNVHGTVKRALEQCISSLTPENAERAVGMYNDSVRSKGGRAEAEDVRVIGSDLKGKGAALPLDEGSLVTPECTGGTSLFSPSLPARNMGRFSDVPLPSATRKSARLRLSSAAGIPAAGQAQPPSAGSEWACILSLVGEHLTQYLPRSVVSNVRLTCSSWCQFMNHSATRLVPLAVHTDRIVRSFPRITSLDISCGSQIYPEDLIKLAAAYGNQLQSLSLSHNSIESVHLPFFVSFRTLTSLNLSECALLKSSDLATLGSFASSLTHLNVSECHQLTNLALAGIVECLPGLHRLDLSGCRLLNNAGVACLTALSDLTTLGLENCHDVSDASMATVAQLTGLESLNLLGLHKLTDMGAMELSTLTALKTLSISSERFNGSFISVTKTMPVLEALSLRGCRSVLDSMLMDFLDLRTERQCNALQALTSLDLSYCTHLGTGITWAQLTGMPVLARLNMSYTKASGYDVERWLGQLRKLTDLNLEGCKAMTEKGLDALIVHEALEKLNLRGCSSLGYYAIKALEDSGIEFAR